MGQVRSENFEGPPVEPRQFFAPVHDVNRGPFLRAGFGHQQTAGTEIECRKFIPSLQCSATILPLQPAGNHQMDDSKEIIFKANDDLLAQATYIDDSPSAE